MKKFRLNLLARINLLIASLIALLGIGGCKHQKASVKSAAPEKVEQDENMAGPVVCKYGVPRAGYSVSGVVVDTDGVPQQCVVWISTREDMENAIEVQTDESGKFATHFSGFPADSMYFKVYNAAIKSEPIHYGASEDSFNLGETETNVVITVPARPDNGRMLLKYGVPARFHDK